MGLLRAWGDAAPMSDLKMTITSWGQVKLDDREVKKVMRAAGNDVKTKTSRLINQTDGGGRITHKPGGGTYRASMPGNPPVRSSGALRQSLKTFVYKSGMGFAVRARQFYALFLESGAHGGGNQYGGRPTAAAAARGQYRRRRAKGRYTLRVMEPRPFLDRVIAAEAPELDRRIRTAFEKGITWKATK
jgi:hypothetical protein